MQHDPPPLGHVHPSRLYGEGAANARLFGRVPLSEPEPEPEPESKSEPAEAPQPRWTWDELVDARQVTKDVAGSWEDAEFLDDMLQLRWPLSWKQPLFAAQGPNRQQQSRELLKQVARHEGGHTVSRSLPVACLALARSGLPLEAAITRSLGELQSGQGWLDAAAQQLAIKAAPEHIWGPQGPRKAGLGMKRKAPSASTHPPRNHEFVKPDVEKKPPLSLHRRHSSSQRGWQFKLRPQGPPPVPKQDGKDPRMVAASVAGVLTPEGPPAQAPASVQGRPCSPAADLAGVEPPQPGEQAAGVEHPQAGKPAAGVPPPQAGPGGLVSPAAAPATPAQGPPPAEQRQQGQAQAFAGGGLAAPSEAHAEPMHVPERPEPCDLGPAFQGVIDHPAVQAGGRTPMPASAAGTAGEQPPPGAAGGQADASPTALCLAAVQTVKQEPDVPQEAEHQVKVLFEGPTNMELGFLEGPACGELQAQQEPVDCSKLLLTPRLGDVQLEALLPQRVVDRQAPTGVPEDGRLAPLRLPSKAPIVTWVCTFKRWRQIGVDPRALDICNKTNNRSSRCCLRCGAPRPDLELEERIHAILQTSGEQEVDVEDVMAHLEVSAGSAVGAGFAFTADEVEGALAQAQAARETAHSSQPQAPQLPSSSDAMGLAGCEPISMHQRSNWEQTSDASSLSDLDMELQDWQQEPDSSLAETLHQLQRERPPDNNAGEQTRRASRLIDQAAAALTLEPRLQAAWQSQARPTPSVLVAPAAVWSSNIAEAPAMAGTATNSTSLHTLSAASDGVHATDSDVLGAGAAGASGSGVGSQQAFRKQHQLQSRCTAAAQGSHLSRNLVEHALRIIKPHKGGQYNQLGRFETHLLRMLDTGKPPEDEQLRQLFVTLPPEEHRDVELLEAAHDSEMDVAGAVSVPGRAEPRGVRCQASAGAVSDQTLHVLLGGQNPYSAINAGQGGTHNAPNFRPATLFRLGQEARRTWLVAPQLSLSTGHQRAVAQARHNAYMADLREQDRLRYYKQAAASNGRQKIIDYEVALKKGRSAAAEEAAAISAAKQRLASCALRPRTAEGFRPVVHVQQPAAQQQRTTSDHLKAVGPQQLQQQQVHEPPGGDDAAVVFQAAGVTPVPKFLQTGKSSRDGKTLAAESCASKWALLPISTREDPEMHQIAAALHDSTVENTLMQELASAGESVQALFLAAAQSGVSLTVLHSALERLHNLQA